MIFLLFSKASFAFGNGPEWLPHALEAYDLSSLLICAIVLDDGSPYAIIKDPKGYTHRAFLGDFMGKNYGRIHEINKNEIKIEELIEEKKGEWVSKHVILKYVKNEDACSIRMPKVNNKCRPVT
jgi:Tfp pilus assembly protein PilP